MGRSIGIPLFIAGAIGLYIAAPDLLRQDEAARRVIVQPTPGVTHSPSIKGKYPDAPVIVRSYSSGPYWIGVAAITCTLSGIGIALGLIVLPRKQMCLVPIDDGYRLLPRQSQREKFRGVALPLGSAAVSASLLAAHLETYLQPLPPAGHLFAATAATLVVGLVLYIARGMRIGRVFKEPRLTLSTANPRLDEPFKLRLDFEAIRRLHVEEVRARICCFEHVLLHVGRYTQLGINSHGEKIVILAEHVKLAAGQVFSASADVFLDSAEYLSSGKTQIASYPFYHWEIHLEFGDVKHATTIFPITFTPPSLHQEQIRNREFLDQTP